MRQLMRRSVWTPVLAVIAVVLASAPSPADAASFPAEIRGTVAGFDVAGLNTKWQGTVVLKKRLVDPVTKRPDFEPTYVIAAGTQISWSSDLVAPCQGHGEGVLGPGELDGVLTISPDVDPRFPKFGRRWSMVIGPANPVGQQRRMPVDGTCPAPPPPEGRLEAVQAEATTDYLALGYNGYNPNSAHPENDHTKDLKSFKGLGQATGEFGNQHWEWDLRAAGGLKAVPRARPVTRAGRATLDGSRSTVRSKIKSYKWEFDELPGACPNGAAPRPGAGKTGRVVKIVALCSLKVTLTVSDGTGDSDTATTVLTVNPRKNAVWRTPFSHREAPKTADTPTKPPSATSVGGGNYAFAIDGGVNVSDCGPTDPSSMILCPKPAGAQSWLNHGYELKQVNDPRGPFDKQFYVNDPSLRVKRAALINPTILPRSEFYDHNLKAGTDVAGFLRAVRQHEGLGNGQARTGHSGILKDLVGKTDTNPRRSIEATFGPGRPAVAKRADKRLLAVNAELDKQSADPLAHIWSGPLFVYDSYVQKWVRGESITVPGNTAR